IEVDCNVGLITELLSRRGIDDRPRLEVPQVGSKSGRVEKVVGTYHNERQAKASPGFLSFNGVMPPEVPLPPVQHQWSKDRFQRWKRHRIRLDLIDVGQVHVER